MIKSWKKNLSQRKDLESAGTICTMLDGLFHTQFLPHSIFINNHANVTYFVTVSLTQCHISNSVWQYTAVTNGFQTYFCILIKILEESGTYSIAKRKHPIYANFSVPDKSLFKFQQPTEIFIIFLFVLPNFQTSVSCQGWKT